MTTVAAPMSSQDLTDVYTDLHAHPELSYQETRTCAIVAERLTGLGYEVTTGIGGTGVVGVLRNGDGPAALLRADMDALPLVEKTGLDYASTVRATDRFGKDVGVMHACGHDVHVTCLLGAAAALATDTGSWAGTLVVLFQPAEELGTGARTMVDDGLYDVVPRPDVVLGQHVAPLPAGFIALHPGPAMATSDSLTVTLRGSGGHGSRPETTVDPIVMAAATVLRLQTIVSRETAGADTAVVTVGMINSGTNHNIIPDEATLLLNVRTFDDDVRTRTLASIKRIAEAEAAASGAQAVAEVELDDTFPMLVNDPESTARTHAAFLEWLGPQQVIDAGPVTGSEDVGELAKAAGVPCVFWFLGGSDPALFAGCTTVADVAARLQTLPSNHSPLFAPLIHPTLDLGVEALVRAARTWLPA